MGITIALCLVDSHVPISFEPLLLISMWLLLHLIAIAIVINSFLFDILMALSMLIWSSPSMPLFVAHGLAFLNSPVLA